MIYYVHERQSDADGKIFVLTADRNNIFMDVPQR